MAKHHFIASTAVISSLALTTITINPGHSQPKILSKTISFEDVEKAQDGWCDALVQISTAYATGGINKAKPLAGQIIDAAYGYNLGPVAFKPTWATGKQTFRTTRAGALSYFVGGDPNFNDKGFAIGTPGPRSPWVGCEVEDVVVQLYGNTATSMGWVHTTAADGSKSTVEKFWTFIKDDDGNLRIVVHHSSDPFSN
ncbi:MAG: hypothetical protein CL862_09315 [Cyanobium sp. NAT70]|nr:hypothetical protein [Cyanobium sp. NAT70]|tara:strand:+ start:2990 stop:3580 length:591 start_codon:yes stop_codon:yes gene_type:complete